MTDFFKDALSRTWALLVGITLASWLLGSQETGAAAGAPMTIGILALALFKVRLVIRQFMDVAEAPFALKCATDLWLLAVLVGVLTLFYL